MLLAYGTMLNSASAASSASQYFQQAVADRMVTRQISLSEIGFSRPTVLSGSDSQREIFLPVPAGVPLSDATLQFKASYFRADGGRTSMTLAVDGYPVVGRKLADDRGDVSQALGIDGLPRASGFVRFGMQWSSVVSDVMCSDQRAPGNVLRVEPDSRFSYRYDRSDIKTLSVAWSALPPRPTLLVAGRALTAEAYDTAWRIGLTMERAGKRVRWLALPAVGDMIDLSKINVPAELRGIPAFAAVAGGSTQHKIRDAAEIGALLTLGRDGPLRADVVVNDVALNKALHQAVNALAVQIQASSSDAALAYAAWIANGFALLGRQAATDLVQLSTFAGNSVILVSAGAGARAAGLFGTLWRPVAAGQQIEIKTAKSLSQPPSALLLSQFGAMVGTIDVLAKGERSVAFDISALESNGSVPDQAIFDVSAAPGPSGEAPVASIFFNDFLLGAQVMKVDGKPHRIAVNIPRYAIAARNEVRISFLRQPTQIRCHDVPTAFPVSIFPSSHLTLKKISSDKTFVGVASQYSDESNLVIKADWLDNVIVTAPLVVRIADASGMSPEHAQFQVLKQGETFKPNRAFLAFDLPSEAGKASVAAHDGKLMLTGGGKTPVLELTGLENLAVAEVADIGGETGITYYTVGKVLPSIEQPFRLARGNLAVLDNTGSVLQFDKSDPTGSRLADEGNPQSLWQRNMGLWLILIGIIAFVLISARVAQVRRVKQIAAAAAAAQE